MVCEAPETSTVMKSWEQGQAGSFRVVCRADSSPAAATSWLSCWGNAPALALAAPTECCPGVFPAPRALVWWTAQDDCQLQFLTLSCVAAEDVSALLLALAPCQDSKGCSSTAIASCGSGGCRGELSSAAQCHHNHHLLLCCPHLWS